MLPQVDPLGRIYSAAEGVVAFNEAGLGYNSAGQLCTTTSTSANDTWVGGVRLSPTGQVVVAVQSGTLFYNNGLPFNASDGSMARQLDQTPGADEPYVHGIRVGPLGGVHMSTSAPP